MANSANNQFSISGFVATEPRIAQLTNSAVCRFALSIVRKETYNGETTRHSVLVNVEVWRKSADDSAALARITKGKLVQLDGFFKPHTYTDGDGAQHSTLILVAQKISDVEAQDEPEAKPKGKKAKTKAAAA